MAPAGLDVSATWQLPLLPDLTVTTSKPALRVTTDVDTSDGSLAEVGVTLRHVAVDPPGGSSAWSLRLPGYQGALAWTGPPDAAPAEALRLLRAITADRPLDASEVTATTRRHHWIEDPSGRLLAEVVDDIVDGPNGRRRRLDVLGGDRRATRSVTRALRQAGARRPRPTTKASPPAPTVLRRKASTAAYVTAAIAAGRARLLEQDPRLRLDSAGEAVHQARVASRRLRSDLSTLGAVLDPAWAEQVRSELRWVGDRLGAVRDADVLSRRLRDRARGHDDLPGLHGLLDDLADEREEAVAELRVALDSPRYLGLLATLAAGAGDPPLRGRGDPAQPGPPATGRVQADDTLGQSLPALLERPWRRMRRKVRGLGDDPSTDELHAVRIRAKQLRYAAEGASPVLGRGAAALAAAAKDVQTVLGDHHDAVVAEAWLRRHAAGTDAEVAFAAGVLVGDERATQAELAQAWRLQWRTLDKAARHLA